MRRGNLDRDQALKIMSRLCAWCGRKFTGKKRHELTVHHKLATIIIIDRNAIGFYRYSSNFEFLMSVTVPIFILNLTANLRILVWLRQIIRSGLRKTHRQIKDQSF